MMNEKSYLTGTPEYGKHFWNAMRGDKGSIVGIEAGRSGATGSYALPNTAHNSYMAALAKESLFRQIGTTVEAYNSGYRIFAHDCGDMAQWIPENGAFPIEDGMDDFTRYPVESWKLGILLKLDEDFIHDVSFNIEDYLTKRLAKNFGKAEDEAFLNGTGSNMPTGILNATGGAAVGHNTGSISYDDVISLYFSVDPDYRKNGIWLMNDETALVLRTLKDNAGNYLWRSDDTILGKRVIMNNAMPSAAIGTKPIAFGDFNYYWVIGRRPVTVIPLYEKFTLNHQIGYLAFEFLDGKLSRPDAIKVLQIENNG